MKNYNANEDYSKEAERFQSVASFNKTRQDNLELPIDRIDAKREETRYSCADCYQMGNINDNQIYIATTDGQHDQIVKGEHVNVQGGLSGYFSDQATIDACRYQDVLDNTKYNEMCQIAPFRVNYAQGDGDATYKPHVDCFTIDREALFNNYGTYDFNAAIAKCEANNQYGSGGGNQGYNPYISEMIDNGSLKYTPQNSYSDMSISRSEHNNTNVMNNSVVPESKADQMYADAQSRARDCVNNNTPHPSAEACSNGFPKNENPIESNTGHASFTRSSANAEGEGDPRDRNLRSGLEHPVGAEKENSKLLESENAVVKPVLDPRDRNLREGLNKENASQNELPARNMSGEGSPEFGAGAKALNETDPRDRNLLAGLEPPESVQRGTEKALEAGTGVVSTQGI